MITLPSKMGQIITILQTEARNWLSEHLGLEEVLSSINYIEI